MTLVGRKGERSFSKVEQLSGRTVALTSASAAGPLIQQVNQQLALRKRPPIKVEWVDSTLAVEDVLEMVQAGIYHLTVVEQPIARRWARVMPRLRLDSRVRLGPPQAMRWYVGRDAPQLLATVDHFLRGYRAPDNQDAAFERIYRRQYRVHNPLASKDRQRLARCGQCCRSMVRRSRSTGSTWRRWLSRNRRSTRPHAARAVPMA